MVIQHNIPAINSHRNLAVNNRNTNKNLEKLSSGFRINRAGDDAAGLAISEKMRGQIRGLAKAEENTSNAINLIQTAEGGMQELHSIAQRMRELSVQATNGTYHDDVDREALDLEFQELKEEFNRITDYTNYNGIKLLNGDPFEKGAGAGASEFTKATNTFLDVVKGGTTLGYTTGGNGNTAQAAQTVKLRYDAEGNLDLAATKTATGATGFTDIELNDKGELVLTSATAGVGKIVLEGDWSKSVASFQYEAEISVKATAAGVADYTFTTANQKVYDVKDSTGHTAAPAAGDITLGAGTSKTGTGAGDPWATGTTAVKFDILYDKDGNLDLEAMNKAVADSKGARGDVLGFELTATNQILVKISDGAGNYITANVGGAGGDWSKTKVDGLGQITMEFTVAAGGTGAVTGFAANVTDFVKSDASAESTLIFQVGANGTKDQQVYLQIYNMAADQLGANAKYNELRDEITEFRIADDDGKIKDADGNATGTAVTRANFEDLTVEDLNILSTDNANVSIQTLTKALDDLSMRRAELGAKQNRLEYTLNNLGVTKENLTAAESTIRDVDMAKEMMEFTKNSILVQANQAMLAQANTLPQGILQLLR